MSENEKEVAEVKNSFPEIKSYADVYDRHRLLNDRMILAHAIHINDEEIETLLQRNCGISHCPISNIHLKSGLFRLTELARRGLKIGFGSDISGGYALGMLPVIREASTISRALAFQRPEQCTPVSLESLFYFATLGGAQVCGLPGRVGTFAAGYEFDALLISTYPSNQTSAPLNPGLYVQDTDTLSSLFEKWIFCGDDRNIVTVFVKGQVVSGSVPASVRV